MVTHTLLAEHENLHISKAYYIYDAILVPALYAMVSSTVLWGLADDCKEPTTSTLPGVFGTNR